MGLKNQGGLTKKINRGEVISGKWRACDQFNEVRKSVDHLGTCFNSVAS